MDRVVDVMTPEDAAKENIVLTPTQYFDLLKGKRQEASREELQKLYDSACELMTRYQATGQKSGALKLYNFATLCEREMKAIDHGVNTYINRFDLDEYIANIANKTVVIIELSNFERDLPDSVIDKVIELKENNIFDEYYVVFTDYTGKERSQVEQKKRDKDPILLGSMMIGNQVNSRLYYIDSWEDEYCDLTLDKMIKEFADKGFTSPVIDIKAEYPTVDDFRKSFDEYKASIPFSTKANVEIEGTNKSTKEPKKRGRKKKSDE